MYFSTTIFPIPPGHFSIIACRLEGHLDLHPGKAHEYFQFKSLEVNRITHLFESLKEQRRQGL